MKMGKYTKGQLIMNGKKIFVITEIQGGCIGADSLNTKDETENTFVFLKTKCRLPNIEQAFYGLDAMGKRITTASIMKATGRKYTAEKVKGEIGRLRALEQCKQRILNEKAQKPVKTVWLEVEWKDNRTWGATAKGKAKVYHKDGTFAYYETGVVSGCGYDKHSTVLAELLNYCMKGELWAVTAKKQAKNNEKMPSGYYCHKSNKNGKYPYAFYLRDDYRAWEGGVGADCYPPAIEWLGGTMEHTANGKMYDAWKITM